MLRVGEVFCLDAKAAGEKVATGGWRCEEGRPTRQSEWFAADLNRCTAPWAFARGEAFCTIASLELLGALVSVMVLLPVAEGRGPDRVGGVGHPVVQDGQPRKQFPSRQAYDHETPLGVGAHGTGLPTWSLSSLLTCSVDPTPSERRSGRPDQRGVRPLRPQASHSGWDQQTNWKSRG